MTEPASGHTNQPSSPHRKQPESKARGVCFVRECVLEVPLVDIIIIIIFIVQQFRSRIVCGWLVGKCAVDKRFSKQFSVTPDDLLNN